jgi:hypothetical protein
LREQYQTHDYLFLVQWYKNHQNQKEKILEISKIFSNSKPIVKLNIKECLSLDLLNFVSIDDFPFYKRWGNAGVTNLNHIMDTVTKKFLTFEKIKTLIKSNNFI